MFFRLSIILTIGWCIVSCRGHTEPDARIDEKRIESNVRGDEIETLWYNISYEQLRKSLEHLDPNDPFFEADKAREKKIPELFREAGFRDIDRCQSLIYCWPKGYLVVTADRILHSRIESLIGCKGLPAPTGIEMPDRPPRKLDR